MLLSAAVSPFVNLRVQPVAQSVGFVVVLLERLLDPARRLARITNVRLDSSNHALAPTVYS